MKKEIKLKNDMVAQLLTEVWQGRIMYVLMWFDAVDTTLCRCTELRDAVGYEDRFMVGRNGILISKTFNRELSQTPDEHGYLTHATKIGGREGKNVLLRVHRLVCEAFHPNLNNKPFVNHKDGIKTNNDDWNLEWCTQQENSIHAYQTGLAYIPEGYESPNSKVGRLKVQFIRRYQGKISSRKLGKLFNLHHDTILDIWNHRRFNEVSTELF